MSHIDQLLLCKGGDLHISPHASIGIVAGTVSALAGWAAARIFMNLNPIIGLVFGASAVFATHLLHASSILNIFNHSALEKIAKLMVHFLTYIAGGYAGVNLLGYSITFEASLCLGLLIIPIATLFIIALKPILESKPLNIE